MFSLSDLKQTKVYQEALERKVEGGRRISGKISLYSSFIGIRIKL
jgi:predicted transposase YdaD